MTKKPLNQYTDICRDAIQNTSAKLSKTFENLLLEILLLYMVIQGKINFTQMERYGSHDEQTYRNNFGLKKSKYIDWLKINAALADRYFGKSGRKAIAIAPATSARRERRLRISAISGRDAQGR